MIKLKQLANMKMLFLLCFSLLIVGCNGNGSNTEVMPKSIDKNEEPKRVIDTLDEVSDSSEIIEEPIQVSKEKESSLAPGQYSITAVYKSAALYAGSTQYVFTKENGEDFDFSKLHRSGYSLEELKEMKDVLGYDTKIPENMLDPNIDPMDGPPGANPQFIGKTFLLVFNKNEDLVEIKLEE